MVGRCGGSILADMPNRLGVYVYAPYSQRLQNCTQKLGMDEATARRMIREVDRARELYHRRYCPEVKDVFTDHDLMLDSSRFFTDHDLMLDSSRFGVEGSARLLAHIAQTLFET